MTVATKNGQVAIQIVRDTVTHHGATRDELIPILNDLNRRLGYLSGETLNEVSRLIGMSRSQLFGVASFYQMLSTKPLGEHVIQFCESAPCHVVGGRQLWQALRERIEIESGRNQRRRQVVADHGELPGRVRGRAGARHRRRYVRQRRAGAAAGNFGAVRIELEVRRQETEVGD